jgi:hypothetical protein
MPIDIDYQFDPEERNAPSAPMVRITLMNDNRTHKCLALLDSGSGITTITEETLKILRPKRKSDRLVAGATGGAEAYPQYLIEKLYFSDREYSNRLLVFLKTSTRVMIIGRDILNNHHVLLDGPEEHLTAD